MFIIVPIIMLVMILIAAVALGSITISMAAMAGAMNMTLNTQGVKTIKAIIFGAGALAFVYVWFSLSMGDEKGFEYALSLILKLSLCMLIGALMILSVTMSLRGMIALQSYAQSKGRQRINLSIYHCVWVSVVIGLGLMLSIEIMLVGDTFAGHVGACAHFATFKDYDPIFDGQEFLWCVENAQI